MVCFPNAKINIGLNIVRKRGDGYHDIETALYPLPVYDVLEIIKSAEEGCALSLSGLPVDCNAANNLCFKTYALLEKEFNLSGIRIHLHKIIPSGAGLGGGSSDGACTIKMLNELFELGLSLQQMQEYAGKLGSDCSFFLENAPVIASGRGDIFTPVHLPAGGLEFVAVCPEIQVSTAYAYSLVKPAKPEAPLYDTLSLSSVKDWRHTVHNYFEDVIFPLHTEISDIKKTMYREGALYASMTGSGSAVYGLFGGETAGLASAFKPFRTFFGKMI